MCHIGDFLNSSDCQTMAKAEQTLLLHQRLHFVILKITKIQCFYLLPCF